MQKYFVIVEPIRKLRGALVTYVAVIEAGSAAEAIRLFKEMHLSELGADADKEYLKPRTIEIDFKKEKR